MKNQLYTDLLKKVLIDYHRLDQLSYKSIENPDSYEEFETIFQQLNDGKLVLCKPVKINSSLRLEGRDWPVQADTMIGLKRLNNIEFCFREVIEKKIPGDFIETGVWRGGSCIFMKALLKAWNIKDRVVWVADSFEGLPPPNIKRYFADEGSKLHLRRELAVPIEEVKNNFRKYDLLDENVKFLKGWFKDTLHEAPVKKLAILRLDGDLYESTMDALVNLYPKLSVGGYIIVDDWGAVKAYQKAVKDFRLAHNITEEIEYIDWTGIYWRKDKYF